ncbi:hypothetical protein D3C77_596160 [compost metagenome]
MKRIAVKNRFLVNAELPGKLLQFLTNRTITDNVKHIRMSARLQFCTSPQQYIQPLRRNQPANGHKLNNIIVMWNWLESGIIKTVRNHHDFLSIINIGRQIFPKRFGYCK